MQNRYLRLVFILTTLAFIFVGILGLTHFMGMHVANGGMITNCRASYALPCSNIYQHISIWQRTFTAIPSEMISSLLLLVIVFASLLVQEFYSHHKNAHPLKFYLKENPNLPLFDYLKQIFSAGILNPKVF